MVNEHKEKKFHRREYNWPKHRKNAKSHEQLEICKFTMWNHFHSTDGQNYCCLQVKQYQMMARVCGGMDRLISFWWECKAVKLFSKPVWHHLLHLNIYNISITYDLLIPLSFVYLREIFPICTRSQVQECLQKPCYKAKNWNYPNVHQQWED